MTESLEQWGPRPPRIALEVPAPEVFRAALAEGRGLVVPTAHFGGWEVGARFLTDLGRPVNVVTAHERNPTARDFIHRLRTRHGVNVIYSDHSVFASLPVLRAFVENLRSDPPSSRCGEPVTGMDDLDGVKLLFGSRGWLLHRLSGTEPIIRIYAEHENPALIEKLLDETEAELGKSGR